MHTIKIKKKKSYFMHTFGTRSVPYFLWCLALIFHHLSSSFSSQLHLNHFAQRDPPRVTSSLHRHPPPHCAQNHSSLLHHPHPPRQVVLLLILIIE